MYSNDYQTPLAAIGTSAATITNTTPCYHTGYRLADGQVQLGALLRTHDGASTIQVTNKYAVRAKKEEKRTWLQVDQAMYLRRDSGRAGNLRVIAAVTNGAETSFSKPVFPYVPFTSDESAFWKPGGCDKEGCQLASFPISYAILIWNVQGQDVAIVVHRDLLTRHSPLLSACSPLACPARNLMFAGTSSSTLGCRFPPQSQSTNQLYRRSGLPVWPGI